jgi:hypothetical protein
VAAKTAFDEHVERGGNDFVGARVVAARPAGLRFFPVLFHGLIDNWGVGNRCASGLEQTDITSRDSCRAVCRRTAAPTGERRGLQSFSDCGTLGA